MLDPARLANVVLLHFEGDECGGMERFIAEAPQAAAGRQRPVGRAEPDAVRLPYVDRVHGVLDGDTLDLGGHKLRFWETPHVHHWDSMMVVEEIDQEPVPVGPLHPARRSAGRGDGEPRRRDVRLYREIGIFAHEDPVRRWSTGSSGWTPGWVHAMHGGTLTPEALPRYVDALRNERFGFQGKSLGREIPASEPAAVSG